MAERANYGEKRQQSMTLMRGSCGVHSNGPNSRHQLDLQHDSASGCGD